MCGIAGILSTAPPLPGDLAAMSAVLSARGPDDQGEWSDPEAGIALAHRRLAVLDLSPAGHQPMASEDGRFVLTYNGEIYNFDSLRRDLESERPAVRWRGGSDTEVLLAAIARWGLLAALREADGMFALALWDRRERTLHLARDRMGEKPLYVGRASSALVFGSTLTALRQHRDWNSSLDLRALGNFLRFGYIRGPRTIFVDAFKVPPAHVITVSADGLADAGAAHLLDRAECYWSLARAARRGAGEPLKGDGRAVVDAVEQALVTSIRERMVADVPLGAFLSGGVDSSLVVALMQSISSRPVRTFTMGFHAQDFDEAPHAREVARHLGTDHMELYLTGDEALEMVPRIAEVYDEPFADASQLPTLLLSQLTRRHVTVALSGDGGDELFYGYARYGVARRIWTVMQRIPPPLRRLAAWGVRAIPSGSWDTLGKTGRRAGLALDELGHRAHRLADRLRADDFDSFYGNMLSIWPGADALVIGLEPGDDYTRPREGPVADRRQQMMFRDQTDYLPDDVLVKVDRASMEVALEVRVPLLSRHLIELAWRLPPADLARDGRGKWMLRQILYRHVPSCMVDRPKQGFGVPVGEWLRGPLRTWADDLLSPERLRRQALLQPRPIERLWRAHLEGRADHGYALWALLMLQGWLERE